MLPRLVSSAVKLIRKVPRNTIMQRPMQRRSPNVRCMMDPAGQNGKTTFLQFRIKL